jgi:hypothetical protein
MSDSNGDFAKVAAVLAPGYAQVTRSGAYEIKVQRFDAQPFATQFEYEACASVETLMNRDACKFGSLRGPRPVAD